MWAEIVAAAFSKRGKMRNSENEQLLLSIRDSSFCQLKELKRDCIVVDVSVRHVKSSPARLTWNITT